MLVHWMRGDIAEIVGFGDLGQDVFGLFLGRAECDEMDTSIECVRLMLEAFLFRAKCLAGLDALQLIFVDQVVDLDLLLLLELLLHRHVFNGEVAHEYRNCCDEAEDGW